MEAELVKMQPYQFSSTKKRTSKWIHDMKYASQLFKNVLMLFSTCTWNLHLRLLSFKSASILGVNLK